VAALRASQAPPPADKPPEPPAKAPAPCADGGGGGSSSGGGNAAALERQRAAAAPSTRMREEAAVAALQVGIQLLLLFPGRAACYHDVLAVLASRLSDAMCPLNTGSGAAEQRPTSVPADVH